MKRYPRRFHSYERARTAIRDVCSKANSGHLKVPKPVENPLPPIPESKAKPWDPFLIEEPCTALVISDLHFPYHDTGAITTTLEYADPLNPTLVLINGDLADNHSLSKFEGNPENKDFAAEVAAQRQFLAHLRARYPKARIVLKMGNHDEWYWRYLWRKAPELLGCDFMGYDKVIEADKHGVEIVSDQRIIMLGKLPVLHGHEWRGGISTPVNPARGAFLKAIDCVLQGHLHRASEHSETTLLGRLITTWSTGCLCHMHPEYARINRWSQGFAVVHVAQGGDFRVDNRRILHGKVL